MLSYLILEDADRAREKKNLFCADLQLDFCYGVKDPSGTARS